MVLVQKKTQTNGSLWVPEAKFGKSGREEDKEKNDANLTRGLTRRLRRLSSETAFSAGA